MSLPRFVHEEAEPASLRCSDQLRALEVSPLGTTARCEALMAVEVPLPWAPELSSDPRLERISELCGDADHRLQAVVPRKGTPEGRSTMVRFARAEGATGFHRTEAVFASELRDETAARLLAQPVPPGPASGEVTDVFICAHGSRDRCCGGAGTALQQRLVDALGGRVVVWRTSHLGGHRFAPTALTMPDGHAWSHLDADLLAGIAERSLPTEDLAGHDRGCAGLDDRWQQAADAELLRSQGWGWITRPRSMRTQPGPDEHVRLVHVETADGSAWVVEVRAVRSVPVPVCGRPLAEAEKSEDELEVVSVNPLGRG